MSFGFGSGGGEGKGKTGEEGFGGGGGGGGSIEPIAFVVVSGEDVKVYSLKKEKDFKFTPDFTKQVLGWSLRSKASITPIKIVIPLVKFAANRKVLRFALQITSLI